MNISSIHRFLTEDAAKTLPRQHVYIGPIWDLCGLEYRPHMGYTCGIHIGSENGFRNRMGPIWDLSGIQYGTHVFLRYITHVSHVDPIWIPHECQMFPRWLLCKSFFNPRFLGCILLMFSVFLWCMPDLMFWCGYMFLKEKSKVFKYAKWQSKWLTNESLVWDLMK